MLIPAPKLLFYFIQLSSRNSASKRRYTLPMCLVSTCRSRSVTGLDAL